MKILNSLCFNVVKVLLLRQEDIQFIGPLKYTPELALIIEDFTSKQNTVKAPYLEEDFQKNIESDLKLKENSMHFYALKDNRILTYLRLTPNSFELSRLSSLFSSKIESFSDYYEISRLNTDYTLNDKSHYARLLLFKAGLWLFSETNARGLIGICKVTKERYFQQFGMTLIAKDYIEAREATYNLIAGSKEKILITVLKQFWNKIKLNTIGDFYESRKTTRKT